MAEDLAEALAAWAEVRDDADEVVDQASARVHAALLDGVVLLPVRTVAIGEQVAERTGLPAEREAELSLLTVSLPGDRRVLPVFTDADELRRWRLDARPVQASMRSACQAAVDEGWSGLVVDPVTRGFVVTAAVVEALARGALPVATTGPSASSRDDAAALLRRGVAREPAVAAAWLDPGTPLTVVVRLKVPLDEPGLATIADRLSRRLGQGDQLVLTALDAGAEPATGAVRLWP